MVARRCSAATNIYVSPETGPVSLRDRACAGRGSSLCPDKTDILRSIQSPREFPLMDTRFIPKGEFNSIANAYLVVNHAEIVPNDMSIDSQLFSHVAV